MRSLICQETLAHEITAYATAVLRARMGVLHPATESPRPVRDPSEHHNPPLPSPAPPVGDAAHTGTARAVVCQGQRYAVTPALLNRFCELTGVSPSHIGGNGSNLAGIAFYFRAFAIVTAGREIPLERLERLLDQLRACREAVDRFVAHRLNSLGWTPPRPGDRALHAAIQAPELSAGMPPGG